MVDRNFLLLAAFFFEPDQRSLSGLEIILDLQIHDGTDSGKPIGQGGEQRSQAKERTQYKLPEHPNRNPPRSVD